MSVPTLLGRVVPPAGLAVDLGDMFDYLMVKNKSAESGMRIAFSAIPSSYGDPFFFPHNGGFDMGGLAVRRIYLRADVDIANPTGMAAWLRSDSLTGLVNLDPVPLWTDSGLMGNDAAQGVPANQPIYLTARLNGFPSVAFDNLGAQFLTFAAAIPNVTAVFWVARLNSPPAAPAFWLGSPTSDFYPGPARQMWDPALAAANVLTGVTQLNGVAVNGTATNRSDTDFEIWSLRTAGAGITADSLAADVGLSMAGEICELIIFDTPVSATKAREVEAYLSRKYAIGLTPAVGAVEADIGCAQTRLHSLTSTRGGPVRACNPYPFMIQLSEPLRDRRKMDTIVIPQRGLFTDWITNSMGGDAGDDSPIYY